MFAPSRPVVGGVLVFALTFGCFCNILGAQTVSPSLNGSQNPPSVPPPTLSAGEVSSTLSLSAVNSGVGAALSTDRSSGPGKSFGTAGRGLPGMAGGGPVNSGLGAQDPSATYMRPPTLPPILCDPAVDWPC